MKNKKHAWLAKNGCVYKTKKECKKYGVLKKVYYVSEWDLLSYMF